MKTQHTLIRNPIRLILAGSVFASNMAAAQLQDFGGIADNSGTGLPIPATLNWPAWYRDNSSLPLGLCKSLAASPDPVAAGGQMCFPIAPNPAGFAGNVGDEIFYTNLNANITNGGIDLRYVSAVEAAYASGTPVKGQEMVFARTRFVMSVTGPECAGTYRIIHPWGDNTFTDVPEGPRALFETADIGIAPLDFTGALQGPIGPFLHWDNNGDEIPLPRTPANGLKVGTEEFVGDPNVEHTYTGSPFVETLPDGITPRYTFADGTPQHQNYLKVIAPAGCDIGGTPAPAGEGVNVQKQPLGFLLGQVWTAPIPTATEITQAVFSRNASATTVDVWAKTDKNAPQVLQVMGNDLPGVVMTSVLDNGAQTGTYQAHMVLGPNATLPPVVELVNTTSNPVVKKSAPLSDIVFISKAEYDPATGNLCVSAHSSDDQTLTLTAGSDPLTVQLDSTAKTGCPAAVNGDLTATAPFPLNRAPDKVLVVSQLAGSAVKQVTVLANSPDNTATLVAHADTFTNVPGFGPQELNVGANDSGAGEIVIVDQPGISVLNPDGQPITQIVGTATGSLTGGTATFTANPGAAGKATFSYFVKNGTNVSNLANATVDMVFVAGPPTVNPDNFAVSRTNNATGFTAKVLQNDVASVGTTIDTASVQVRATAAGANTATVNTAKGVATANADGTITYRPNVGATAGTDSYYYTVKNTAGTESTPVRVDVVVENTGESVSIQRNKYSTAPRWDLRFSTNWFGAPLTSTGSCWLVRVNGADIPTPRLIGRASVDAAGAVQMQPLATKLYNAANYDPAVDVPMLPARTNYTIRCGTSTAVVPLPGISNPVQSADNSTTSP
ncbi:MAG: Ig-like domain-containing protein [Methylomicrobium sp.]